MRWLLPILLGLAACSQAPLAPQVPEAEVSIGSYNYDPAGPFLNIRNVDNRTGESLRVEFRGACQVGPFDPLSVEFESGSYSLPSSGALGFWLSWAETSQDPRVMSGPLSCQFTTLAGDRELSVELRESPGIMLPAPSVPPNPAPVPQPGVPLDPFP